ncbi:unnamed protein product [Oikopleura dioica]|uniref:Proliferating cell nuclear antigen n=1 Tax=Oikopleura dioica TaxID=34765 RepID=E4XS54_OIKDI|nr:unnamed protein product [Oikopleura dioica]
MPFSLVLNEAATFKNAILSLKGFITTAVFYITSQGLEITSQDANLLSMIELNMPQAMFDTYSATQTYAFGVRIDLLATIVGYVRDNAKLELYSDANDTDSICLSSFDKASSLMFSYKIKLVDTDPTHMPKQRYVAAVTMQSVGWKAMVDSLADAGKDCLIIVTDPQLIMISEREHLRKTSIMDANKHPSVTTFINALRPFSDTYLMEYLKHFSRHTALNQVVRIRFTEKGLLCVTYLLGNSHDGSARGLSTNGHLTFVLSPVKSPETDSQKLTESLENSKFF